MIVKPVIDALLAVSEIANALAQYEGAPAIISTDVPEQMPCPFVVVREVGGVPWGTRGNKGGLAQVDVQVFDDKLSSSKAVRDLAWLIWRTLDRNDLATFDGGYWVQGVQADPPADTNDGFGFPGRTIRVQVRFMAKD